MGEYTGYFQALLWTCTSCGFIFEGGQPQMECLACEAYKTAFIDIPQHIEQQVREQFPDVPPNHIDCRNRRLELLHASGQHRAFRVSGRVLPTESGQHIDPAESGGRHKNSQS